MALLILPDLPRPAEFIARLNGIVGPVLYRHPSDNPWVMGSTGQRRVIRASNRDVDVMVIGRSCVGENYVEEYLSRVEGVDDLDALAREVVRFDALLLARDRDSVRAQAPSFLTRSFFWTSTNNGPVLSDEQLPLARLHKYSIDPGVLVSRMTDAELSYPFSLHSIWQGVEALGPGEYLKASGGAMPERRRFWTPPSPTRRLAELAPKLAAGMHAAVGDRTAGASAVSTDLSGGLDSTTLSFYTAEHVGSHYTFFMSTAHEENSDQKWAYRAAQELGTKHLVAPYQDAMSAPSIENLIILDKFPEGPSLTSASAAASAWIAAQLEGTGSTLHFNGHGGDALFGPISTMMWSLVHSKTPGRFRRALRHCTLNRIPLRAAVKMLMHRGNLRSDLIRLAESNFAHPCHPPEEYGHWVVTPHLDAALTDDARGEFARLVRREAGREIHELSPDRTVHQIVQFLTVHGADVRRMNHVMGPAASMYFDSPYLDVRVVEPALALNICERTYQYPAKPLLAAARPPSMSIDYFLRRDKGDYSSATFHEHRSQRARIRSLFQDGSELEDMGMISLREFMRSLDAYSPDGQSHDNVSYIEIAERWLRSLREVKTTAEHMSGSPC